VANGPIVFESCSSMSCKVSIWSLSVCMNRASRNSGLASVQHAEQMQPVDQRAGSVGNLADIHPILTLPWFAESRACIRGSDLGAKFPARAAGSNAL
jgi:hypothetical protein